MSYQHEAWWDLSTVTQIKLDRPPSLSLSVCFSLSLSFLLSATSSCNHCELAPRHKHSLGHISAGFSDLSSFKPHTHVHTWIRTHAYTATQYDPTPTLTQFLQKASQQQVLGIKISFVSLRRWDLIGWEWGHVTGVGQWREWRTMRIKLPVSLLPCVRSCVCVCSIYISSESVSARRSGLWVNTCACRITRTPC